MEECLVGCQIGHMDRGTLGKAGVSGEWVYVSRITQCFFGIGTTFRASNVHPIIKTDVADTLANGLDCACAIIALREGCRGFWVDAGSDVSLYRIYASGLDINNNLTGARHRIWDVF